LVERKHPRDPRHVQIPYAIKPPQYLLQGHPWLRGGRKEFRVMPRGKKTMREKRDQPYSGKEGLINETLLGKNGRPVKKSLRNQGDM